MDTRIKDSLVNQAVGREHPNKGLLVNIDRGSQYTSQRFQALLLRYGCHQSMSRKGNPYDNAVMKFFTVRLKESLFKRQLSEFCVNRNSSQAGNILNGACFRSKSQVGNLPLRVVLFEVMAVCAPTGMNADITSKKEAYMGDYPAILSSNMMFS